MLFWSCVIGLKCYRQLVYPLAFCLCQPFLQVVEQCFVRNFNLSIGLQILRCGVDIFYPISGIKLLIGLANELRTIFQDDGMGYSEPTHNVPLHKLCELCGLDLHVGLSFRSLE